MAIYPYHPLMLHGDNQDDISLPIKISQIAELKDHFPWELQLELLYYLDFDSIMRICPNEDKDFWQKKAQLVLDISKDCFYRKDIVTRFIRYVDIRPSRKYLYFLTQRAFESKKPFILSSECVCYNDGNLMIRLASEQKNIDLLEKIIKELYSTGTTRYLFNYYYGYVKSVEFLYDQPFFHNELGLTQNSYNGALAGSIESDKKDYYIFLREKYRNHYRIALENTNHHQIFGPAFKSPSTFYLNEILRFISTGPNIPTELALSRLLIESQNITLMKTMSAMLKRVIPLHQLKIKSHNLEIVKYFIEELNGQCNFLEMLSEPFDIPDDLLFYLLGKIEIEIESLFYLLNNLRFVLFQKIFDHGNFLLDEKSLIRILLILIGHRNLDMTKYIFDKITPLSQNSTDQNISVKFKNLINPKTLAKKVLHHINKNPNKYERKSLDVYVRGFKLDPLISDYLNSFLDVIPQNNLKRSSSRNTDNSQNPLRLAVPAANIPSLGTFSAFRGCPKATSCNGFSSEERNGKGSPGVLAIKSKRRKI